MDPLVTIMIGRDEILSLDVSRPRSILDGFIPDLMGRFRNAVVVLVNGYDDDPRELYDIDEVRSWFARFFDAVPELFFWMDMRDKRLIYYALMMGTPIRKAEGATVSAEDIAKFMVWGFANLNTFCAKHGLDHGPSNRHIRDCGVLTQQ